MSQSLLLLAGTLTLILVSVMARVGNVGTVLPDVVVIFTVWAALRRNATAALTTALVLGLLSGALVGGGRGVLLLSLLPVVFAGVWARRRGLVAGTLPEAGWVIPSVLLSGTGFAFAALIFLPGLPLGDGLFRTLPLTALVSGLFALPIFWLLNRVVPLVEARQERGMLVRP